MVHIICGPTASGKSGKALALAQAIGGEIINCDSLQIYKGLELLTASPSYKEQSQPPHHLYNFLDGKVIFDAARWIECAVSLIQKIEHPIIVGGTGLYIKALIEGLSNIPPIEDNIRSNIRHLQETMDAESFYKMVVEKDPKAKRFKLGDKQRLCRALEVYEQTGHSITDFWEKTKPPLTDVNFKIEKVLPDRPLLYKNIENRFDQMIKRGALEQVKEAMEQDLLEIDPLGKAIGFKELSAHLRDELPLDQAIELSKTRSRQYAKRQYTWFHHQL